MRLTAGTLLLDGQVRADGHTGGSYNGGSSGGGIYVATTNLVGAGRISANGGTDINAGGGGGRVAVYARDFSGFY